MAISIAIVGEKGGACKTTNTQHIAISLATKGYRVLVLDYDTQANLTSRFMGEDFVESHAPFKGVFTCLSMGEPPLSEVIRKTPYPNVWIAPQEKWDSRGNAIDVAIPITMGLSDDSHLWTKDMLGENAIQSNFDFILIDNEPGLKVVPTNAIAGCDYVFLAQAGNDLAINAIPSAVKTFKKIKERQNPDLEIIGAACMNYSRSSKSVFKQTRNSMLLKCQEAGINCIDTEGYEFSQMGQLGSDSVYDLAGGKALKVAKDFDFLTEQILEIVKNYEKSKMSVKNNSIQRGEVSP